MKYSNSENLNHLCKDLVLLEEKEEAINFLKDLCAPKEINSIAGRWRVCKLLHQTDLSYRDIHKATGVSLTTISRVARFLKNEPYQGYLTLLKKITKRKNK